MNVASMEALPVVLAEATSIPDATEPRFSPDGSQLLTVIGSDYVTMDIDGENQVAHLGGADYLSNGAWVTNNSFLYIGEESIGRYDMDSKSSTELNDDGFASYNLDYNEKAGKFIYMKNGGKPLNLVDY